LRITTDTACCNRKRKQADKNEPQGGTSRYLVTAIPDDVYSLNQSKSFGVSRRFREFFSFPSSYFSRSQAPAWERPSSKLRGREKFDRRGLVFEKDFNFKFALPSNN
jgi:hypothetical protein